MYKQLKQGLKKIVPKQILFKYEPFFRRIFYQLYKGNKFYCNICGKSLRKFIAIDDGDSICPNCGSISRSRKLWELLKAEFLKSKIEVLDLSPTRCIYRILKKNPLISYTSTDISGDFISEKKYDITNIDAMDESYDLIICYHVLELIENDIQAMKELYRILKSNGTCIIQTPFKEGETYENSLITTDEGRLEHFGLKDHVRIYSVKGLNERLISCGFNTEIREYNENIGNKFGFKIKDTIFVCTK